jgi:hypothetical protein
MKAAESTQRVADFMSLTLAFERSMAGWEWAKDTFTGHSLFVSPNGERLLCLPQRGGWLTRHPFDAQAARLKDP